MYKKHVVFTTPEDNTKIWRYMDLAKLLDILYSSKLYFPRADQLGDPYEGSYPKANIDYRNAHITEFLDQKLFNNMGNREAEKIQKKLNKSWRKYFGISSWCMTENESAALWHIYGSNSKGLAIQSTIGRLKESLKNEQSYIYIGKVFYINYLHAKIPDNNKMYPFIYKRESYKHENELRAITFMENNFVIENNSISRILKFKGYPVSIDPKILIEKIHTAPACEKWQHNLVKLIAGKYKIKVKQSDLTKPPLY